MSEGSSVPLLVGVILAIGVGIFATVIGMDRDRAFYPTVMIVIAFLYSLFALAGGSSTGVLLIELAMGAIFVVLAAVGFRTSLWLVVIALAGHGIFDVFHPRIVTNPGVPTWWPAFCAAYDIVAAGYLAWLIRIRRPRSIADS